MSRLSHIDVDISQASQRGPSARSHALAAGSTPLSMRNSPATTVSHLKAHYPNDTAGTCGARCAPKGRWLWIFAPTDPHPRVAAPRSGIVRAPDSPKALPMPLPPMRSETSIWNTWRAGSTPWAQPSSRQHLWAPGCGLRQRPRRGYQRVHDRVREWPLRGSAQRAMNPASAPAGQRLSRPRG
jgi:hypothetical protein